MADKQLPTDQQILELIYERYYDQFEAFDKGEPSGRRSSVNYVPIDIEQVAAAFGVTGNMIYGRLYYHIDKVYRYKQEGGSEVHLFASVVGSDRHCIHFPYLASVLAHLRSEESKFRKGMRLSIWALVVSVLAFLTSVAAIAVPYYLGQ